jgi:uncharacterized sulfatase
MPQLYNLITDRRETTNLAADHPEVVKRLTTSLLAWHRTMPPDKGLTYGKREKSQKAAK